MVWKIYSGSRAHTTHSEGAGCFLKSNQVPFPRSRWIELGKVKAERNKRKRACRSGGAEMGREGGGGEGWSLPPTM